MNRLFSYGQAQIDHVYTWVCIIEPIRAIASLLCRSNRFPIGVLKRHQHFKHTTPLAYSSAMIPLHFAEFIRSQSVTALASQLPSSTTKLRIAIQRGDFYGFCTNT